MTEKQTMHYQLRKLNRIAKVLDLQNFYSVSVDQWDIYLQGEYSAEKNLILSKYFDMKINKNTGRIEGFKNDINVTLS